MSNRYRGRGRDRHHVRTIFKFVVPVFNVTPAPGEPAAFVFRVNVGAVRLDTSVLSDGSYGVRVTAGNLNQTAEVLSTT